MLHFYVQLQRLFRANNFVPTHISYFIMSQAMKDINLLDYMIERGFIYEFILFTSFHTLLNFSCSGLPG